MSARNNAIQAGSFVIVMILFAVGLAFFVGNGGLSDDKLERYDLVYDSSVMGLSVGAPVTLRGVKIGEVQDINVMLYSKTGDLLNIVEVALNPETVSHQGSGNPEQIQKQLLAKGLAAKLKTQSILTGLLYIEMDFYRKEAVITPVKTRYPQLPTVASDFDALAADIDSLNIPELVTDIKLVAKSLKQFTGSEEFKNLPANMNKALASFEVIAVDLSKSMTDIKGELVPMAASMRQLSENVDAKLPGTLDKVDTLLTSMNSTLSSIDETATALEDVLDPESPLFYQLEKTAQKLDRSADAVAGLAELLEEQPTAIITGKREE